MLSEQEIKELMEFVQKYLPMAEDMAQLRYGFFHGGDPRNFSPDPDASSEEERKRHKEACEAWERGERPDIPPSCEMREDAQMLITRSVFGLGTIFDGEEQERCHRLREILERTASTRNSRGWCDGLE